MMEHILKDKIPEYLADKKIKGRQNRSDYTTKAKGGNFMLFYSRNLFTLVWQFKVAHLTT